MSALKHHKKAKHEGIRYPCDQCEYSATQVGTLKKHKEAKHEGIRYPCDQCEYSATQMSALKTHKEAKHEGIRYPYDQCEYSAIDMGTLKTHKEAKHEGISYPCAKFDKKEISPITMKVKVMVEKLPISKYQGYLQNVQEPEFIEVSEMYEVDKEIKPELDIDPLSVINYDDTENNTTVNSDFETKIEKEEDSDLKTESSDLSEFIEQCNREDGHEVGTLQEDNIAIEIINKIR